MISVALMDIDLLSLQTFRTGPPFETFAQLRREAPAFLHRRPDRPPFWVLTRHEDIVRVSRDWSSYSSQSNGALLDEQPPPLVDDASQRSLVSLDPPEHTALRALVGEGFRPGPVDLLAHRVRTLCTVALDRVCERGECDFVRDIAAEFSLAPLAEMLGFPDAGDRHYIHRLTEILSDPLELMSPGAPIRATLDIFQFAHDLTRSRGEDAGDDLLGLLMRPRETGQRLTPRQFELFFLLLVTAGHMTTQQLMSGAMLAFFENPGQWQRLVANPALLGTGVDELARWVSPVMQFQRTATRDAEIAGQPIAKGDRLALYYVAANRDETVFGDADRLDLARAPNDHVGFGAGGPHHCLGERLARLQIRTLFEELAQRMPDIELAGPPDYLCSAFLNGIRSMPVRFTPTPPLRQRPGG